MDDNENEPQPTSRRSFLGRLAAIAAVLTGVVPKTADANEEGLLSEEAVLKKSIEEQFNVWLLNTKELAKVDLEASKADFTAPNLGRNILMGLAGQKEGPRPDWDLNRLRVMKAMLSVVPAGFTRGRMFILSNGGDTSYLVINNQKVPEIMMDHKKMVPSEIELGFEQFIHELTHSIDPGDIPNLGLRSAEEKKQFPWYEKIFEIIGTEPSPELVKEIKKRMEQWNKKIQIASGVDLSRLTPEEKKKYSFDLHMEHGLISQVNEYPREMLATFCQHAVYGEQVFIDRYKDIYGEEKSKKLYRFVIDIYQGKENLFDQFKAALNPQAVLA